MCFTYFMFFSPLWRRPETSKEVQCKMETECNGNHSCYILQRRESNLGKKLSAVRGLWSADRCSASGWGLCSVVIDSCGSQRAIRNMGSSAAFAGQCQYCLLSSSAALGSAALMAFSWFIFFLSTFLWIGDSCFCFGSSLRYQSHYDEI